MMWSLHELTAPWEWSFWFLSKNNIVTSASGLIECGQLQIVDSNFEPLLEILVQKLAARQQAETLQ